MKRRMKYEYAGQREKRLKRIHSRMPLTLPYYKKPALIHIELH